MKGNSVVSIILPTYNVYPYLAQCLDSIAHQTYEDIEVIIVIDGATDNSYELAEEYCKKDKRFNVYWQENTGSGPARNNGLARATGEFIVFVDPDDWIKNDYIERLVLAQKEKDYDIVVTTSEDYYFSKEKTLKYKKVVEVVDEFIIGQDDVRNKYCLLFNKYMVCAPTKTLYKTNIIKEHNITFPDLRRSQDIVFNYRYYDHISSVRILNYHGYCYRIEFSQLLNRLKPDYYKTIKLLFKEVKALHERWHQEKNIPFIATVYTRNLSVAIESCVIQCQPIILILNDDEIQRIVKLSKVGGLSAWCFKSLFISKNDFLMKVFMRIKHYIKQKRME